MDREKKRKRNLKNLNKINTKRKSLKITEIQNWLFERSGRASGQ